MLDGRGTDVVLVHRTAYDDWSLPKGKVDTGESEERTALREVEEEAGVVCRLGPELPSTTYRDRYGRPKVVRYWAMTVISGEVAGHHEVDEARWVPLDGARRQLSYPRDVGVLDALEAAVGLPTVPSAAGRSAVGRSAVGRSDVGRSDVGGEQPDDVLEQEPEGHQAQRDADGIGGPARPGPAAADPDRQPQQ
jgi:8-oxo-dGTP diphosphatase